MSKERKTQPIFMPSMAAQALTSELANSPDKRDRAMAMLIEGLDTLTQEVRWLSPQVVNFTDKMEEYVAVRVMRYFTGVGVTFLLGVGVSLVVHILTK